MPGINTRLPHLLCAGSLWGAANCAVPPGPPNATDAELKLNHAVLVVGYDMSYKPYKWIVSESGGVHLGA